MKNLFSYQITNNNKILIFRNNKRIKIVKGKWCDNFIASLHSLSEEDIQLKLAKITGHYKHGNERKKI